jgi:hypothetical protein
VKQKHVKTFESIFAHRVLANIQWPDIIALFRELGAEIIEREGSHIGLVTGGCFIVRIPRQTLIKVLWQPFASGWKKIG